MCSAADDNWVLWGGRSEPIGQAGAGGSRLGVAGSASLEVAVVKLSSRSGVWLAGLGALVVAAAACSSAGSSSSSAAGSSPAAGGSSPAAGGSGVPAAVTATLNKYLGGPAFTA